VCRGSCFAVWPRSVDEDDVRAPGYTVTSVRFPFGEAALAFSNPITSRSPAASASRLRVVRLGTCVPLSRREMAGADVPIS
jgi:hypothetical protein